MKGVTVILVALMLMLGVGTARAAGGSYLSSSVATAADQAELSPDDLGRTATLYLDTDQDSGVNGQNGLFARQSIPVWNYAISPQVTIDLEYQQSPAAENSLKFISDGIDVENVTQNFMLGFHYTF
jgi:hypothetical protein